MPEPLFVGHNPTSADLCHLLDDSEGDHASTSELLKGFPPCALAVLEVGVPWSGLAAETGRLVGYHVGHDGTPTPSPSSRARVDRQGRGGAGVVTPSSASAASTSSRLIPSRYMIASR